MLGKDSRVIQLNSIEIFFSFLLNVYRAHLNQTNRSGNIGQGFESQQSNTVVESVQNHGGNVGQGFESKPNQSTGEEQGYRGDIGQGFESQSEEQYGSLRDLI